MSTISCGYIDMKEIHPTAYTVGFLSLVLVKCMQSFNVSS